MTKIPDYSKYTLDELVDAYENIDRYRFPERVKLIEDQIKKIKPDIFPISNPAGSSGKPSKEEKKKSVKKKTNLKLELADKTIVENPTEEDIISALKSLSTRKNSFAILSENRSKYIQVSKNLMSGYYVEYMEKSAENHYKAIIDCLSLDFVIRLFQTYLQEGDKWKSMIEWRLIPPNGSRSQFLNWVYQKVAFLALFVVALVMLNRDKYTESIQVFFEEKGINIGYPIFIVALVMAILDWKKIKNLGKIDSQEKASVIAIIMLLLLSLVFIFML